MKICENGTIRDMTTEEIAAMQEAQLAMEHNIEPLTDSAKLALMLAAIPEEPVPTMAPKVGYKWQPVYSSSAGFAWELVEDPSALGTLKTHCDGQRGMRSRQGTTILTARTSMSHWRTACQPGLRMQHILRRCNHWSL